MTMNDTPTTEAPKPKRKVQRRKPAAKPAPVVPPEFAGLKPTECCDGCRPERCVISEIGHCAHPMKGGLPGSLKGDHEALKRFGRAQRALADAKLDLISK